MLRGREQRETAIRGKRKRRSTDFDVQVNEVNGERDKVEHCLDEKIKRRENDSKENEETRKDKRRGGKKSEGSE